MNHGSWTHVVLSFVIGCADLGSGNGSAKQARTTRTSDAESPVGSSAGGRGGATETMTGTGSSNGAGGSYAVASSGGADQGGMVTTADGSDASIGTVIVVGRGGSSGSATGGAILTGGGGSAVGTGSSGAGARPNGTAGVAGAAGSSGRADTGSTGPSPSQGSTCLRSGDGSYGEKGPYKTARKDNVDLASLLQGAASPTTYSIIYPDPLEANCLHPIVAWGNGTGVEGQGVYDFFNVNGASWGLVVIVSDNSNVGSGQYHKAGIDYLLKENENPSSTFYHRLSTRAGTTGHSQGGMGATAGSAHPNVVAEVCVAGAGTVAAKVAFMCLTGTADMAESSCTAAYQSAPGPAFLGDWEGGDHTTTETVAGYLMRDQGSMQMQRLSAAWFRCFLAEDQVACAMFRGSPCGICKDPGWATIAGRNIE